MFRIGVNQCVHIEQDQAFYFFSSEPLYFPEEFAVINGESETVCHVRLVIQVNKLLCLECVIETEPRLGKAPEHLIRMFETHHGDLLVVLQSSHQKHPRSHGGLPEVGDTENVDAVLQEMLI